LGFDVDLVDKDRCEIVACDDSLPIEPAAALEVTFKAPDDGSSTGRQLLETAEFGRQISRAVLREFGASSECGDALTTVS
jgi:hypothetical protein